MRVPKFRAWVKTEKRMLTVGEIDFDYEFAYLDEGDGYRCERDFDEIELMQFIGLKDIHGTEVFDGDIIKDSEGFIAQVVYDKEYAGFGLNYQPFDPKEGLSLTFEELKNEYRNTFEIIGNIYENLELLGE